MRITSFGKMVLIAVALAGLAFATAANASVMSGSMAVVVDPFAPSTASYTGSSVNLNAQNLITTGEQGTFLSEVPAHSDLTADSATITGLSTTPLADSIGDFFVFSTPDAILGTLGTSPNNRFDFNLLTITEASYTGPSAGAVFTGTGTLVDTQAVYSNTPAEFTLSFPDGGGNYSFTFATVPEPTTVGLIVTSLGALALRRRRV